MKKLFIVLFILSMAWLIKLSYDLHILNKAQTEFNQSINQLQQQNANLNDQFVALKRQIFAQQENAGTTPSKASVGEAVANETQNDIALIQQHLDLIEFALKQQQYATAIEKLNQLSNELDDYILAPALVSSLQQVIAKIRTC